MVRVTKSVEYALIALQHIASHGRRTVVSARELAELHGLPAGIVAKVMQRLCAAGIVASEHGAHGGYRLALPLTELTLFQTIEAVEGPFQVAPCGADHDACQRSGICTVSGSVTEIGMRVSDLFSSMTVAELLGANERGVVAVGREARS